MSNNYLTDSPLQINLCFKNPPTFNILSERALKALDFLAILAFYTLSKIAAPLEAGFGDKQHLKELENGNKKYSTHGGSACEGR
jgi:hypothetical protein